MRGAAGESAEKARACVGVEARRDARKPFEVQVRLSGVGGEAVTYLSQDLGKGGLFLRTTRPLARGTQVGLSFVIPGGVRVSCLASVAWTTAQGTAPGRCGMGLRFTPLEPEELSPLIRFLDADAERRRVLILEDDPVLAGLLLASFAKLGASARAAPWRDFERALSEPHGLLVVGADRLGLSEGVVRRRPVPRRVALLGFAGGGQEWHPHAMFCFQKPVDPEQVARISLALFR